MAPSNFFSTNGRINSLVGITFYGDGIRVLPWLWEKAIVRAGARGLQTNETLESDGYQYDNYGLSLMEVIMNNDNTPVTLTTRWNLLNEDEESIAMGFLKEILGKDVSLLLK